MTDQSPAERFAAALQSFEASEDSSELLSLFADNAELHRPEVEHQEPARDAKGFWEAYRRQFEEISTEFSHIVETPEHVSLEWQSKGRLATGLEIAYRGVSLLALDGEGLVERF